MGFSDTSWIKCPIWYCVWFDFVTMCKVTIYELWPLRARTISRWKCAVWKIWTWKGQWNGKLLIIQLFALQLDMQRHQTPSTGLFCTNAVCFSSSYLWGYIVDALISSHFKKTFNLDLGMNVMIVERLLVWLWCFLGSGPVSETLLKKLTKWKIPHFNFNFI